MAYQTRQRDPLLDIHTQDAIRKRGSELMGLVAIALAAIFSTILWSYSPNDSGFYSAVSQPVQNRLGAPGAVLASWLMLTLGMASWVFPVLIGTWGMRFVLHLGDRRMFGRAVVMMPVFVAASAIFLAANIPPAFWAHNFGLGGVAGDAALGVLIDWAPFDQDLSLLLLTLALAGLFVATGLCALGFTRFELRIIGRTVLLATILTYASALAVLGLCLRGGVWGVRTARNRIATRRQARTAMPATGSDTPGTAPATVRRRFFRISIPGFRTLADDDACDAGTAMIAAADTSDEGRLRPGFTDVIPSKVLRARSLRIPRPEPPVTENIFRDSRDEPAAFTEDTEQDARPPYDPVPSLSAVRRAHAADPAPSDIVCRRTGTPRESRRARAEAQPNLFGSGAAGYGPPPLNLLQSPSTVVRHHLSDEALEENARMLENVLDDYGVKGEVISVRPGPVVTMYELGPAPGLKSRRVIGLADDIARSMSALSARVSTVPGRSVIGIELPNENRETVLLREILSSRDYGEGHHALPLALGKDIGGTAMVADLARMPHLLIAGTTGSGKSVAINTMILSLLYKLSPDQCRMIMIDPKMLELSVYDGIPHLLSPVVTDPKKAVTALKWVVSEMEDRYRKMSKMGVRNIRGYNDRVDATLAKGEDFTRTVQTGFDDETGEPIFETEQFTPEKMPFIVVIVDEMADLMMVAGKEIEACIQRLAQMARASGIHLIMATQRPSVDVITGTIKANFPTRISFQVTSKIDSRTILGEMGAEHLLGMGDMLYMAGGGKITRVHAPFASDEEVEEIVTALKAYGPPVYVGGVVEGPAEDHASGIDAVLGLGTTAGGENALYDQAVAIVTRDRKCSTSYIQRKLAIGYNKAARLVEQMEDAGIVSRASPVGKREVLVPEI
ncbi:MAG: DNA translocase FtsK 4TM domain-containing protein [Rhodobacteraceae bacterium]|nr:DNA translocase FtsK 4TM domain-containing protein [Paracoccaceae bacterium]